MSEFTLTDCLIRCNPPVDHVIGREVRANGDDVLMSTVGIESGMGALITGCVWKIDRTLPFGTLMVGPL